MSHNVHGLQERHGGVAAFNRPGLPIFRWDVKKLCGWAADPLGDSVGGRDAPRATRALAPRASVKLTDSHVRNLVEGWYVVRRPSVFHHRRSPLSFPDWEYLPSQFRKFDHAEPL